MKNKEGSETQPLLTTNHTRLPTPEPARQSPAAKPMADGRSDGRQESRTTSDTRPSWDEYFMKITEEVRKRSTCLRRQTGAILVKDKRILATGYNGAPSGLKHCAEIGCLREEQGVSSGEKHELCRGLHAEQNAIIQAALYGIEIKGATIYSTHQPCVLCAKMIMNAGIKKIVFRERYPDGLAEILLKQAGVELTQFS